MTRRLVDALALAFVALFLCALFDEIAFPPPVPPLLVDGPPVQRAAAGDMPLCTFPPEPGPPGHYAPRRLLQRDPRGMA